MKVIKDARYYAALNSIRENILKQIKLNFTGSSPPEIFVGEFNYPNIYTGILSPIKHDESSFKLSSPEDWFKARLNEKEILLSRASMVYSRFISNVKLGNKLTNVMQEVSMSSKPIDVNFELKKKPSLSFSLDNFHKPIFNPAPLKKAVLEENPCVAKRVDYIVSDVDMKAGEAILDLYKHNLTVSSINKLLSAGLLGINIQRKLVPTKWAITCVDDTISKNLVEKIKNYDAVSEYLVFYDEYLGNHYEILLIPRHFSFEVIEAKYNPDHSLINFWQDYESHNKRKNYASSVTGAYYANKVAIAEYLDRIKRQASILVLREIRDYEIPCGVGILREVARNAMNRQPLRFNDLKSAFENIKARLKMPINLFQEKSIMLKEMREQTTLTGLKSWQK